MTAEKKKEFESKCKEFSEKCTYEVERLTQEQFREVVYTSMFLTWNWIEQTVESACKKQREICAKEYEKKFYSQMNPMSYGDIMNSILNAPEPKQVSVEPEVKPEIAVLEKKIEGYKKIVQFILDNHWKFGDMEQQLLTKIEKVGEKYDL